MEHKSGMMATRKITECDICKVQNDHAIIQKISVPVLLDSTANEYGTEKFGGFPEIKTRELDLCNDCLKKITKVHAVPRWYQPDEYEIIEEAKDA